MAQVAISSPIGVGNFADQCRAKPMKRSSHLWFVLKRARGLNERLEGPSKIDEGLIGEPSPYVSNVNEIGSAVCTQDK